MVPSLPIAVQSPSHNPSSVTVILAPELYTAGFSASEVVFSCGDDQCFPSIRLISIGLKSGKKVETSEDSPHLPETWTSPRGGTPPSPKTSDLSTFATFFSDLSKIGILGGFGQQEQLENVDF